MRSRGGGPPNGARRSGAGQRSELLLDGLPIRHEPLDVRSQLRPLVLELANGLGGGLLVERRIAEDLVDLSKS